MEQHKESCIVCKNEQFKIWLTAYEHNCICGRHIFYVCDDCTDKLCTCEKMENNFKRV